jgi:hypothetical protein
MIGVVLAGAADVNGDGRVEYSEVAGFLAAASASVDDPRARLAVHTRAPQQSPHTPLVDLKASGAGRFFVVDERCRR